MMPANLSGKKSILVFLLLAAVAATTLLIGCQGETSPVTGPNGAGSTTGGTTEPPAPAVLSPITGLPVVKTGNPVAVSTDNLSPARPQSGLARADIVYEVLAEGPITRYLAIYYSQAPTTVGPVRSVRPYLVLLAKEWDAVLAHCGGSQDGLALIKELHVLDANDFDHGGLYWRDNSRDMPHNLYGSVERLRKLVKEPASPPARRYDFEGWAEKPLAGLEIRYGRRYAVRYNYAGGKYERVVLDGSLEPFVQADLGTGEKPAVSNVIVQFAATQVIDKELRVSIDLIGEGKAVYLLGGRYSEGTWKKDSIDEPTWFYTSSGDKITLTTGQTWVQIVPEDAKVTELPAK